MTEQPTTPAPQGNADGLRTLRRSRDERMLAGVLGGLAQRLGIDPVLLRIVTVVLAVFGGVGIVIYAAGWLLIPDEDADRSIAEQALSRGDDRPEPATLWLAGGLVLAVLFAAGATFGSGVGTVLLVLAATGVIVLLRRDAEAPGSRFTDRAPDGDPDIDADGIGAGDTQATGQVPPAEAPAGQVGDNAAASDAHPVAQEPPGVDDTAEPTTDEAHSVEPPAADRRDFVHSFTAPEQPISAWPEPPDWPGSEPDWPASDMDHSDYAFPAPPAENDKPTDSHLGGLTLSAVAVALGVLAIVDAAGSAIPATAYVALALAVIGAGLFIGTWFGRARGLIAWGLIAMLIALPATAVGDFLDWELAGEDRTITIDQPAELPVGTAEHGIGRVVYDMSDLDLTDADDPVALDVSQNVGELQIIVPQDVDVTVNATTGMGHIDAFAEQAGGHQDIQVIDLGANGQGGGELTLDLDVGLGQITVERADGPPADGIENLGVLR